MVFEVVVGSREQLLLRPPCSVGFGVVGSGRLAQIRSADPKCEKAARISADQRVVVRPDGVACCGLVFKWPVPVRPEGRQCW